MAQFMFSDGRQASPSDPAVQQAVNAGQYSYNPATDTFTINAGSGGEQIASSVAAGGTPTVTTGSALNPGGYDVYPGYQWTVDQLERDFIAEQNRINQEFQARENALTRAAQEQMAATERSLQLELQRGNLDTQKYLQSRTLAQQESEFARTLALQTLQADRDYELRKLADAREERLLQAQLAANPSDFVAYEFYKRGLGSPEAMNVAQQFAQGGTATPAAGTDTSAQPAYADASLQKLASNLFNPTAGASYNPNLRGEGVFGSTIEAPNTLSRAEAGRLSDSEMQILSSFLKGGIDIGGRRVALDPADYFQQAQNSWVPTLREGTGQGTQYAF